MTRIPPCPDGDDVLVIGDYNDDLDESTRRSAPSSPYQVLVDLYFFPTLPLAVANESTHIGTKYPLDHALATNKLADAYRDGSVEVLAADQIIDDYATTTSDHRPVLTRFDLEPVSDGGVVINEILANEPGSSVAGELLEIVNPGAATVDLSGWTLSDEVGVRHVRCGCTL